jgi:LPS sulfotransferase NodH
MDRNFNQINQINKNYNEINQTYEIIIVNKGIEEIEIKYLNLKNKINNFINEINQKKNNKNK